MSFDECVYALSNHEICILPTETVYGLACSALSVEAILKVYKLKGRPSTNPLIVHVLDHYSAEEISVTNGFSRKLAYAFWPGPLTLILPKKKCVPSEITAGLNSVAVRSPSHPTFRKILNEVKQPLAAPSANPSNKISPTNCKDAVTAFGMNCPPFLDGGQCEIGIESTVIDLTAHSPSILRIGPISKSAIEEVLGTEIQSKTGQKEKKIDTEKPSVSPGLGLKHYAPSTPLYLYTDIEKMLNSNTLIRDDILILPSPNVMIQSHKKNFTLFYLSSVGNPKEITKNFFRILNEADSLKKERIHASLFPCSDHLLLAVNDRLRRAASKCF